MFHRRWNAGYSYGGEFEVYRALGVEDVVEQAAVVVVACEAGGETGLELERGCGGSETLLEVVAGHLEASTAGTGVIVVAVVGLEGVHECGG